MNQKCLIWVFLRCNLKVTLLYLKSAPFNLSNCKIFQKHKNASIWNQKYPILVFFWLEFKKKYCHIWNYHVKSESLTHMVNFGIGSAFSKCQRSTFFVVRVQVWIDFRKYAIKDYMTALHNFVLKIETDWTARSA